MHLDVLTLTLPAFVFWVTMACGVYGAIFFASVAASGPLRSTLVMYYVPAITALAVFIGGVTYGFGGNHPIGLGVILLAWAGAYLNFTKVYVPSNTFHLWLLNVLPAILSVGAMFAGITLLLGKA